MKKAALIGVGMVAQTHVDAIADAKNVDLVGVMGRSLENAQRFAHAARQRLGHPVTVYQDIFELRDDRSIDFVILATPPDARLDFVTALVERDIPILLEKPIERNFDAALQIVDLCEKSRVPLGVLFQHRARAASQALKGALQNTSLGQINAAEIRVPWWRDQSYYDAPGRGTYARDGGGVMITQAIHTLDLALWTLGPVARVQALLRTTQTHKLEAEDWAGALFETTAGAIGTIMATTAAFPGDSECITVHGTTASAHLDSGVLTIKHHDGRTQTYGDIASTGGGADPMAFTHAWHQTVIEQFADSLDGVCPPLATGRDALAVHRVIDAMEHSNRTGQWAEVINYDS